jgi:hypothetical protein
VSRPYWTGVGLCILLALAWSVYRKPGAADAAGGRTLASGPGTTVAPGASVAPRTTLPQTLSRPLLEAASRDAFAAWPAPVAAQVMLPPVAPAPPPPPPPAPPPLNLRYAGRMTGPDGATQVFVLSGETSLTATIGQMLPNGYRVEAITARAIELSHPSLNSTARLDLPEPPQHEIR